MYVWLNAKVAMSYIASCLGGHEFILTYFWSFIMSYIEIHVPKYFADHVIEYFCDSMYMLGVDIDKDKDVRYSGFWSQGDGASFKGIVNFSNSNIGQFEKCYPTDEAMLELAKRWEAVAAQLQEVELKLGFNCHRYCHEHTMATGEGWYAEDDQGEKIEELEDEVMPILKGFARQLYKQLKDEYEFQLAHETATMYDELAAEARTLQEQILELNSVTEVPAQVAMHLEELQANRHELLEILSAQMDQLEEQFHYWKDWKQMSIHEFLVYISSE